MKEILNRMKKINKRVYLIIVIILVVLLISLLSYRGIVNRIRENYNKEEIKEFDYRTYSVSGRIGTTLVTIINEKGLEKVTYLELNEKKPIEVYPKGKTQLAFDYKMEDRNHYEIQVEFSDGENKTYTIDYEIPRVKGEYVLVDGIYVNKPDVTTGFVKEKTRYMYLNEAGNLVPGNWLTGEEPENWFNYNKNNWGNIYVESGGVDSYYVWIPRYCYKKDTTNSVSGNERMDVKFINTYDEYIDATTGETITWENLRAQGYEIPEAFGWQDANITGYTTPIPGYWMAKYQMTDLGSYIIDYLMTAGQTGINVKNLKTSTNKEIAKYTYAINGKVEHESETAEEYTFANVAAGTNTVNITALDANGSIIGSMTKELLPAEVNEPELSSFDQDTTFYVYWDSEGNEHNEIPISKEPPENWYNYTFSNWANIVTRNNGVETYLVWIPRYEYSLDQTSKRSNVNFIKGTGTKTTTGYEIPEAFKWGDNLEHELTGYWISKYQLSEATATPNVGAEVSAVGNNIMIKNITGTLVNSAITNGTELKYEYYLNGELKHTGNSNTENYVYENLEVNHTYTVNVIVREKESNKYIGSVTNKLTTRGINAPLLTSFNKEQTYYVYYDEEDNEIVGNKISEEAPQNWYNYMYSKWANIVVTDGNVEGGKITGETYKNYFVWIPRYAYSLDQTKKRSEVVFLEGTSTEVPAGYEIPEAFKWGDNLEHELTGYWISKYQLTD